MLALLLPLFAAYRAVAYPIVAHAGAAGFPYPPYLLQEIFEQGQAVNLSPSSFVRTSTDSCCQTVNRHLCQWTRPDNRDPVLNAALNLTRGKPELMSENALPRQQLIVLRRQGKRPAVT